MTHHLKIIPKAEKDLDSIISLDFDALKKKILSLSANPRSFECQKLTNEDGYRIRAGNLRILYRVDDDTKEAILYRINPLPIP